MSVPLALSLAKARSPERSGSGAPARTPGTDPMRALPARVPSPLRGRGTG